MEMLMACIREHTNSRSTTLSEYQDRVNRWAGHYDYNKLNAYQKLGLSCINCDASIGTFFVVGFGHDSVHPVNLVRQPSVL